MKKTKFRINRYLSLVLTIFLFFSCGLTSSAQATDIQPISMLANNEFASIVSYQKILEYFEKSTNSNSRSNIINSLSSNYGGSFIDEQGHLNINLTNNTVGMQNELTVVADNDSLVFHTVTYTFQDLKDVYDYLCENMIALEIQEVCISETKNKVQVFVEDINKATKDLKNIIDLELIEFNLAYQSITDCATYDLKGGDLIQSNNSSTLSFCAKDSSGNKGIVMAGHGVTAVGDAVKNSSGKKIGSVTKRSYSGKVDAAFVKIKNGLFTKFNATYKFSDNTDIWSWLSDRNTPEGAQIYKYGGVSGKTSGKVLSNAATQTLNGVTFTDLVKTTAFTISGDSGGPGVHNAGSDQYKCLVGIVKSASYKSNEFVAMYYCKIENVFDKLGVSPILCP